MASSTLISICIPAYKRPEFLKRLLDSIAIQAFRDFEVVITDDSPDETVRELSDRYQGQFPLRHYRNPEPLGSPENWNEAIRRAAGNWIKIMHDDDWFENKDSLGEFAAAIERDTSRSFIFSAYRDVFLDEGRTRDMFLPRRRYRKFIRNRTVLFARNIIGPPSVVLYKKEGGEEIFFDGNVKWVVDIDFYIRYLRATNPVYVDKILVNVGLGSQQVTRDCFRLRQVEIPENFYLLYKVGPRNLKNLLVYDAWWRLMRNLEVRRKEDITGSGYSGPIPGVLLSMVAWQRLLPPGVLRVGFVSKLYMSLHYLLHYKSIPS
jgi:glycosyltransferase involved in cell wall biosynthesis